MRLPCLYTCTFSVFLSLSKHFFTVRTTKSRSNSIHHILSLRMDIQSILSTPIDEQHAEQNSNPSTGTDVRYTQCSSCGRDATMACSTCRLNNPQLLPCSHVYCDVACQSCDQFMRKEVRESEQALWDRREDARINRKLQTNDDRAYRGIKELWCFAPDWSCLIKVNRAFLQKQLLWVPCDVGRTPPSNAKDLTGLDHPIDIIDSATEEDLLFLHDCKLTSLVDRYAICTNFAPDGFIVTHSQKRGF